MQTALPPVRNVEVLFRTFIIPARITVHTLIPTEASRQQQYHQQYHYQNQQAYGYSGQPVPGQNFGIQPRNIVLCIIFSIITCGIYGIYWMIKMNDEVNALAGEPGATTGGMVVFIHIDHLWYLRVVLALQNGRAL